MEMVFNNINMKKHEKTFKHDKTLNLFFVDVLYVLKMLFTIGSNVSLFSLLVCGGALNGSRGMFSSPNFPNNYPNNASCNFTITPSNGTLLRIAFRFFQLQFW